MADRQCGHCGRALEPDMLFCPACGRAAATRPEQATDPSAPASRRLKAALFVAAAAALVFLLGRAGSSSAGDPTSSTLARTASAAHPIDEQRARAEARIAHLTKDSLATIDMVELGNLIGYGQLSPDTATMRLLQAEYTRRRAVTREQELLARARALTFSDGDRCRRATAARVHQVVTAHPDWNDAVLPSIICGGLHIGMTAEQVLASWGKPNDINRSTYATTVKEQWVYDRYDAYVYIDDGILTAIQD